MCSNVLKAGLIPLITVHFAGVLAEFGRGLLVLCGAVFVVPDGGTGFWVLRAE